MPRLLISDADLRDDTIDWDEFANSIRSDADPREIRRPEDEDEWEDEWDAPQWDDEDPD